MHTIFQTVHVQTVCSHHVHPFLTLSRLGQRRAPSRHSCQMSTPYSYPVHTMFIFTPCSQQFSQFHTPPRLGLLLGISCLMWLAEDNLFTPFPHHVHPFHNLFTPCPD